MNNARVLVVAGFFFQPLAAVHADGGAVRLSEQRGNYRITVFTAPTPLRAGPVDVSIFVQDAATGEPIPNAQIAVRISPRENPEAALSRRATTDAATNKLFKAALFDLPEPGRWDVAVRVEGLREPIAVHFEIEASEPLPHVWEIMPWIAWPAIVVLLFVVHKWLVGQRIKKASSPEGEPALVTLSPNQRNSI